MVADRIYTKAGGWVLRWFCSFGQLVDGLIGVITLGEVRTGVHLWFAKLRARFVYHHGD